MNHVLKGWMTLLLLMSATVHAAVPVPRIEQAVCTRSAVLLACSDALGNGYSVAAAGKTMYLRGYEVIGKRSWAQTNSRYGQLVFFTGLASDGQTWVGYTRRVGWTTINTVSSSDGTRSKITCNRMSGCQ